jgi:hypothetical protein
MNDKQENYTGAQRAANTLRNLGSLRDGFLVTAAIFYFAGYVVWAINAYRNNLGLLPALEFQYLIAGAPPVLIISALYFLFLGGKLLVRQLGNWIGPDPRGVKLYLCWFMLVLGVGAVVFIMMPATKWFESAYPHSRYKPWLTIISALIIVVSYPFVSQLTNAAETQIQAKASSEFSARELANAFRSLFFFLAGVFLRLLALMYAFMFFIGLGAVALIYSVELYPKIPQEFGGARPYCAQLDVVSAQLSNETIGGILPMDAGKPSHAIVRSLRVEVLFSGSDMMLVRSKGKVFKIPKSTLQTIATCD